MPPLMFDRRNTLPLPLSLSGAWPAAGVKKVYSWLKCYKKEAARRKTTNHLRFALRLKNHPKYESLETKVWMGHGNNKYLDATLTELPELCNLDEFVLDFSYVLTLRFAPSKKLTQGDIIFGQDIGILINAKVSKPVAF